jgi:hypothetical protein
MSDKRKGLWRDLVGTIDLHGRKPEDVIRDMRDGWPDVFETRNCETCKWWSRVYDEWGECSRAYSVRNDPDDETSRACAITPDGMEAFLFTLPDFGCVQWEPREEAGDE